MRTDLKEGLRMRRLERDWKDLRITPQIVRALFRDAYARYEVRMEEIKFRRELEEWQKNV